MPCDEVMGSTCITFCIAALHGSAASASPLLCCSCFGVDGFVMLCIRYHTGNGFFINSSLLMFSLLVNAWLCLLLALSSATAVGSTVLADALALLGGLQLLQLGSLSLLVYIATVWLEDGFMVTLKNVLKQLVAGELSWLLWPRSLYIWSSP